MSHLGDIKNIDESVSDLYSTQECRPCSLDKSNQQANFDEIVTIRVPKEPSPKYEETVNVKRTNETNDQVRRILLIPHDPKPFNKMYGSTKQLFQKQASIDICEETPFLLTVPRIKKCEDVKVTLPKHDSQESVQRIITERRKLDENLKEINKFDIFEVTLKDSDNIIITGKGQRDKTSNESDSQC